jgi:riboflavin synthase
VNHIGPIVQVVFPEGAISGVAIGASVALNGTCLTVTAIEPDRLAFDVIAETLRKTNLGRLKDGSVVNFERSAKLGDEIGGHRVSGHVHSTAELVQLRSTEEETRMQLRVTEDNWMKYILPKGFVAVDGCSLTVGEVCKPFWSS